MLYVREYFNKKWRKRFFVLHKPKGSLPHSYAFEYYKDDQCKKYVNSIDLEQCEEVTASLQSALYSHLFLLRTKQKGHDRTYYLACDTEDGMNRWVETLCSVCNLKHDEDVAIPVTIGSDRPVNGSMAPPIGIASTPPPPNRSDSISPGSLETSGSYRTTSPAVHSRTPSPPGSHNTSYDDHDGLPGNKGNEYVPDPSLQEVEVEGEAEGEGYIPLEDCYSGNTKLNEVVPPPSKPKLENRISIDSVPDELAPLPPPKEGRRESAWDTTYDSPPKRTVPPRPAKTSPITNRRTTSKFSVDQFYDSPPLRLSNAVPLSHKHHMSEHIHTSSVYNVPAPRKHESFSSLDSGASDNKDFDDSIYDTPPKKSHDSFISGDLKFQYPSKQSRLTSAVPAPPRPPKQENIYYNEVESEAYMNISDAQDIETDGAFNETSPTRTLDYMYDFPTSNESISPPPPNACPVSPKHKHGYVNAASGTVNDYLDMKGMRDSLEQDTKQDFYTAMTIDRQTTNAAHVPVDGELYTNLPPPVYSTNKGSTVRVSLSQTIPAPPTRRQTRDVSYTNCPPEDDSIGMHQPYTFMSNTEQLYMSAPNNQPVHPGQPFTVMSNTEQLYMSAPNNQPVHPGPPVNRKNKPKPDPLLLNNNSVDGFSVPDTYHILTTPKTKSFKKEAASYRSSDNILLPQRQGELDFSSSDEDDESSIPSIDPHQTVHLKTTPPAPQRRLNQAVEYLELDHSQDPEKSPNVNRSPPAHCVSPTDYKEIDFLKTDALRETKKTRENIRKGSDTEHPVANKLSH